MINLLQIIAVLLLEVVLLWACLWLGLEVGTLYMRLFPRKKDINKKEDDDINDYIDWS
jgi:hypothetical protein